MSILPAAAIRQLPLSAEPIQLWQHGGDLHNFLSDLFGDLYRPFGTTLFDAGLTDASESAAEFTRLALQVQPPPAADANIDQPPDFAGDPALGFAWKHLVVWQATTNQLLSESAFFSIAHTLEAQADLEVSFILASHMHYKHANQSLRTFIEDVVVQLWFTAFPERFAGWRSGDGRVPQMRGRADAMLPTLSALGMLDPAVAGRISTIYHELNGAVHSHERRLTHRGSDVGRYRGESFKRDDFDEWCELVARVVTEGTHVAVAGLGPLNALRRTAPLRCTVCHTNDPARLKAERRFYVNAPGGSISLHCGACGHQQSFDARFVDEVVAGLSGPEHEPWNRLIAGAWTNPMRVHLVDSAEDG